MIDTRKGEALINEAMLSLVDTDGPVLVEGFVLTAVVNIVESGMNRTIVFHPDNQPGWKSLGLIETVSTTIRDDIVHAYNQGCDGCEECED